MSIIGDTKRELGVPFDGDENRFHPIIRDGALNDGEYDFGRDRFQYQVEIAGAGTSRIDNTVKVDWRPEWVTIGCPQLVLVREIAPLPLFETGCCAGY